MEGEERKNLGRIASRKDVALIDRGKNHWVTVFGKSEATRRTRLLSALKIYMTHHSIRPPTMNFQV